MELEIKSKKYRFCVSHGDILVDSFSPFESYLVSLHGFDERNKTLYKLIPLNGSNDIFDDKELSEDEIKQFIIGNRLIHFSKSEYTLYLEKKEETTSSKDSGDFWHKPLTENK